MSAQVHTLRDRIVARLPPERQAEGDRALRATFPNANDPSLWIFLCLIDEQAKAREESARQYASAKSRWVEEKKILNAIHSPNTWRAVLISRLWNLATVVLLTATIIGAVAWLNHRNMRTVEKITGNPDAYATYTTNTVAALKDINQASKDIVAVAALMNIPTASIGLQNDKIVLLLPKGTATVEETHWGSQITIHVHTERMQKTLEQMLKPTPVPLPE